MFYKTRFEKELLLKSFRKSYKKTFSKMNFKNKVGFAGYYVRRMC